MSVRTAISTIAVTLAMLATLQACAGPSKYDPRLAAGVAKVLGQ